MVCCWLLTLPSFSYWLLSFVGYLNLEIIKLSLLCQAITVVQITICYYYNSLFPIQNVLFLVRNFFLSWSSNQCEFSFYEYKFGFLPKVFNYLYILSTINVDYRDLAVSLICFVIKLSVGIKDYWRCYSQTFLAIPSVTCWMYLG